MTNKVTRDEREHPIITNTITAPENQYKDQHKGTAEALSSDKSEGTPYSAQRINIFTLKSSQYLHGNNNKHV